MGTALFSCRAHAHAWGAAETAPSINGSEEKMQRGARWRLLVGAVTCLAARNAICAALAYMSDPNGEGQGLGSGFKILAAQFRSRDYPQGRAQPSTRRSDSML
jgi:hypothetical protein